ncbi:bifunctional diguanylate cyclase/phosphodiesterase [Shimia sp. SDUM112013]|uniref:putative bifunctional diguanylate cyclase/phosphodiesterase n=1 Tax=Shimia sp. SDUM112013 TaxID=3136160 RepID=UPI0032EF9ABC
MTFRPAHFLNHPRLTLPLRGLAAIALSGLVFVAWWIGGEFWLLVAAVALPVPLLLQGRRPSAPPVQAMGQDALTGFLTERGLHDGMAASLATLPDTGLTTGIFACELRNVSRMRAKFGDGAAEQALRVTADRIRAALRDTDMVARIGDARFAIYLDPVRRFDLDAALTLATRLQTAIEEPVVLQAVSLHPVCCIGLCLQTRAPATEAGPLLGAATLALEEALRSDGNAIRTFSSDMKQRVLRRDRSEAEALAALDRDEIVAWFQPQVSTDTGQVTGFEALARWQHPRRGTLPPSDFLPAMDRGGQLGRLSNRMLASALDAFVTWRKAGYSLESVGVNFTAEDLADPTLVDRVSGALERHDMTPDQLSVEVLENVVAGAPNDMVVRNVNGLARLGCRIDLDDFGTGHASISSIRRLSVDRLKIDRSFVVHADSDPQQQRLVAAIVTMAEQLDLDVLAEGVETPAEHAMLAQLGCTHVQGFGVARPMPFEETLPWITAHDRARAAPPDLRRRAG